MKKSLVRYLLFLIVLPWLLAPFIYKNLDNPSNFILIVGFIYMPLPAIITLLSLKKRKKIFEAFSSGRTKYKYVLYALISVFFFNIINILVVYLLGNLLEINLFGYLNFEAETLQKNLNKIIFLKNEDISIENFNYVKFIIVVLLSPLIGLLNLPFAIGEEFAWRGYLFNKIKKTNRIIHNLWIGLIWGIWHAPIILMGYNFPSSNPFLGLLVFIAFTCSASFLFFYLREKSNSIIAPSVFHGSFNSSVIFITLFVEKGNSLFSNPVGISGIITMWIIYFLFLRSFYKKQMKPLKLT
jgi:membrane protease YdiL (CAAX protease family)